MSSIVHVHHIDEVLLLTQTMSSLEWFVPQLPHAQYYMYISITHVLPYHKAMPENITIFCVCIAMSLQHK